MSALRTLTAVQEATLWNDHREIRGSRSKRCRKHFSRPPAMLASRHAESLFVEVEDALCFWSGLHYTQPATYTASQDQGVCGLSGSCTGKSKMPRASST